MKFTNIEPNSEISLYITHGEKYLEISAVILKHLSQKLTVIELKNYGNKRLNFKNVKIDVYYKSENNVPVVFKNATVVTHKNMYILQVTSDGVKSNRRNSFRVSVGVTGWFTVLGKPPKQTIVKDVSNTGFAITDRKKELKLDIGTRATLKFDDMLMELFLEGTVVRVEEQEDYIIYGFTINNVCKDLSTYIQLKQRRK